MTIDDFAMRIKYFISLGWSTINVSEVKVLFQTTSEKKEYDVVDTYWDGKNFIIKINPST